jgi:hypothetical protein
MTELADELLSAGAKAVTGSIEVSDKSAKVHARLYLYDGGLYAVELDGYSRPVFARLRSSGLFANRAPGELALLAGLDIPDTDVIGHAVGKGWVSIEALANVHQEMLLAALGAVIELPKVKLRLHKGQTTSRFCTLPIPVETLVETVRMRADRLHGTWIMVCPDVAADAAVLRHVPSPVVERTGSPEVGAMANEIDGARNLDAIAHALGFTRAEAVHVAAALIRSGQARVDTDSAATPQPTRYLVPEAFGTHRVIAAEPVKAPPKKPLPTPAPSAAAAELPVDRPVVETAVLPVRPVDDVGERERRLKSQRREVARLHEELQSCVRAEQELLNRTAEVGERLREARVTLAQMEMAEALPVGIA